MHDFLLSDQIKTVFKILKIICFTENQDPVSKQNGSQDKTELGSGDKVDPNQNDKEQTDKNKEEKEKEKDKYFR